MMTTRVYSKALDRSLQIDRLIGHYGGTQPGPTLVFLGGVHGNEPAGVFALHHVLDRLKEKKVPVNGNIIALSGNLHALKHGIRYQDYDLNRQWTRECMGKIKYHPTAELSPDHIELKEIHRTLKQVVKENTGPFYFFDLHTTSSETAPFLTVNDSLLNRKFTKQYPAPIILGIEEYLDGPLLSYVNEKGYVAFGFEGGQHDDLASIENHAAFIYLSLVFTGAVQASDINYIKHYHTLSKQTVRTKDIYEIQYRYAVECRDQFEMKPGYVNFQPIKEGEHLANCECSPLKAPQDGLIFMPLYQGQGDDGYFIIRHVPSFFLWLSGVIRRWKVDSLLPYLPGIRWSSSRKDELVVDLRIARFFTRKFLHLMGYRSKRRDSTHLWARNRESASRKDEYKEAPWFGNGV
jgi:predicted deacylase